MHFHRLSTSLLSLFFSIATTTPFVVRAAPSSYAQGAPRDVYRFPNGTWLENIAVRPNGNLLVTLLNVPELYQVDPVHVGEPRLIHHFPNATVLTGITEVEKDVFVVIAGNFSFQTATTTPGSYSAWKVDMRPFRLDPNTSSSNAVITKITNIPEGLLLNGVTTLDKSGNVLIADSGAGVVWRLDTRSGGYKIVIDDPLMKPAEGPIAVGVNGVVVSKGVLYFSNTFRNTFNRVPINSDGTAAGAAVVVSQNSPADDFTIDRAGNAFLTLLPSNSIQKITPAGAATIIAGGQNSTELVGPTAAKLGRTRLDKGTLYVTTNGGLTGTVAGKPVEGGKVVAVDTRTLR